MADGNKQELAMNTVHIVAEIRTPLVFIEGG